MGKWRGIHSLHFLIFSLFPPYISISYIKHCLILSGNVKYGTFVANFTTNLYTRYEKIILGRIHCEKAPQVVRALLAYVHRRWTHMNLRGKPFEQMMYQISEEITPKTHFN